MSFLTEAWLLDKYGQRITVDDLSEILKVSKKTIQNRLALGKLDIPAYNDSVRFFKAQDVSSYLDRDSY